jgi:DNA invertase Pin-like site-specific DNA recombinase
MKYGYCRVSSNSQSLERQTQMMKEFITDERYIICDKESGKDFNRKGYNLLIGTDTTVPLLHEGDLLIIVSLDRLGRNYTEIRQQWQYITQTLKADIKVLDMPLLDTSNTDGNLDRRFIADLVLQILSYTAEKERHNIRSRQKQGIEIAKAKGIKFGRPQAEFPAEWDKVYNCWRNSEITAVKAMELLGLSKSTFYKLVKRYEK